MIYVECTSRCSFSYFLVLYKFFHVPLSCSFHVASLRPLMILADGLMGLVASWSYCGIASQRRRSSWTRMKSLGAYQPGTVTWKPHEMHCSLSEPVSREFSPRAAAGQTTANDLSSLSVGICSYTTSWILVYNAGRTVCRRASAGSSPIFLSTAN